MAREWRVVFAAAVGLLLSFGSIAVYSFSVFLKHLTETFGWTRGQVSFSFTVACLAGLATVIALGRVVDRVGGRRVVLVATTLFGIGMLALSGLTGHLWHLYVVFIGLGIAGAGTSSIPYSTVVSHWFDKRRGLALGLMLAGGTGLGAAVAPAAAQALVDQAGWRGAYAAFGAIVLLVACPLLFVWFRENPTFVRKDATPRELPGVTAREARRTSTFWIMVFALLLAAAAVQGCLLHLVALLTDAGVSPEMAAFAASVFGASNMLGRLVGGYLLDRIFAPYVVVGSFLAATVGTALLLAGPAWALPAAILMGLGFGAETDAVPYLVSRYFGLRAFGEIYSNAFVTVPLGGAIGPLLVGIGFDRTGSYAIPLACCAAAMLLAAILATRLGAYPTWPAEGERPEPRLEPAFAADGD